MKIGMLWFKDDKKMSLKEKLEEAAAFYLNKYGSMPNTCFVHPSTFEGKILTEAGMKVQKDKEVMENHYWIGVE